MNESYRLNVFSDGFGAFICLLLMVYLISERKRRERTNTWYFGMVASGFMICISDMAFYFACGRSGTIAFHAMTLGTQLYFVFTSSIMFTYTHYLRAVIHKKRPASHHVLLSVSLVSSVISALFALVSPFTGWFFYVSPGVNEYHRGTLFLLMEGLSAIFYIVSIISLISFRKAMGLKDQVFFWSFTLFPLVGQGLQFFYQEVSFVPVFVSLSLLLAFIFIQSEFKEEVESKTLEMERKEFENLTRSKALLTMLTSQSIGALSNTVEAKDFYTKGHAQRVATYALEIAKRLGMSEEMQTKVYYTGLLHDVGKIRVSSAIINKPDRLTRVEYEEMCLHPLAGYYILKDVSAIPDLAIGARWHHERYDGKGYPNGLAGENIPLIARIICVADAYDAMTSNRSYRNTMEQSRVRAEIEKGLGTQFDPRIGQVMLDIIDNDKDYTLHEHVVSNDIYVLAIDDDPMVLKLLSFTLRGEPNLKIITAQSGKEGLEKIHIDRPDVILLDVEMVGMNGFDVLEEIRKTDANLPVIFMTGEKELSIIQKAESLGISDYLTKPIVPSMLRESIRNVLHARRR